MDSDHESSSSSSSFTAPDSRRSCISDTSTGSFNAGAAYHHHHSRSSSKPHKANQAEWEAMKRLRATAAGRIRLDHFRLIRRLGSGDLGNVYLCQLRDGPLHPSAPASSLYAMKVIDREALAGRQKLQRAETEKEILRLLDHPFLPTLFYAAETILALEYLHMMGVVYRDLKPENVLVRDDGHIMLSDFDLSFKCEVVPKLLRERSVAAGRSTTKTSLCLPPPMRPVLSCFFPGRLAAHNETQKVQPKLATEVETEEEEDEAVSGQIGPLFRTELIAEPIAARSKSFVGTHEYLAPEVISGTGHGSAVDWWTLGVFLYEMIYGRTPFRGEDNEKTIGNIMKQSLSFPAMPETEELEDLLTAQDLISKLLAKNPDKRIGGIKGSAEIKRHDFFKGVNWALIRTVKPPVVPRDQRSRVGPAGHALAKRQEEATSANVIEHSPCQTLNAVLP
ncbi:Protein kinase PINOID 2 [Platanthera guangdongensis]|uniref:non-specific serine/threonine protein kinase n=1 Tax=Platanthera guangdongensis TaxID=2320717 RepID=A0ABR2MFR5_9ASPA